jgi:phosphatidylserine/phosphatidylglycerophosphate/cardiolipin synthase-like enzyme
MTKKGSKKKNPQPSVLSMLVAIIVVIGAAFASCLPSNNTPTPGTPATVTTGAGIVPTNTPSAAKTVTPGGNATFTPLSVDIATLAPVTSAPGQVSIINVGQGFGASKGFWQVYFTAPTGNSNPATYIGGIDGQLAAAINGVQRTLDIAAFEWNLQSLTDAVLAAHRRGVQVRMVVDDEHTIRDAQSTIKQLIDAGVPVVGDERSALMHNKFMILDSTVVWTGSWNYSINDTYRNNNNAVALRSQKVVQDYQTEFNEMYVDKEFGPTSSENTPNISFVQNGIPIQVYYASEDPVLTALIATVTRANKSIRFMNFSFTDFDVAKAIIDRAQAGVTAQGIFETTGSQTEASELRTLFCAGIAARQDGNKYILHHKVFIIDDTTVVTGSFNISSNATRSNDENLIIISDPDLAAQYIAEFNRRWQESKVPTAFTCS